MSTRRRIGNIAWKICAAAFLFATAAGAPAQSVYKVVDASGNVTFSDRPDIAPSPQSAAVPDPDASRARGRISGISSGRAAALIDASESARRLRQAQLKRKQGMAPIPGERAQGSEAGAVNYRYWRRQEALRRDVENAQRRSDEASRPHLAGR